MILTLLLATSVIIPVSCGTSTHGCNRVHVLAALIAAALVVADVTLERQSAKKYYAKYTPAMQEGGT
jgi:hypothetical protein